MSRRVNQITIEDKQIRQAVNVGPRGPQGPPGAGARIEGVVNTVGDLPVAADPGSIWIVRPDTMHMWDEVDGWQAVGPVSVVTGPKINDLPTRPGGPQPTDEIWLASAGGAADFKANFNALMQFVASNMATVSFPVETWTPVVTPAGPFSGLSASGSYIKLGQAVFMIIHISWSGRSGGSGGVGITLPSGIGPNGRSTIPATFMRGVTMNSQAVGVPALIRSERLVQFHGGADETAVAVTDFSAGGGMLTLSGAFINHW